MPSDERVGDEERVVEAVPAETAEETTGVIPAVVDEDVTPAEERPRSSSRIMRLTRAAVNADMTLGQMESVLSKLDTSLDRLEPLLDRFERVVTGLERIVNTLEWIFAPALKMRDRRQQRRARKIGGDADGNAPDEPRKRFRRRKKAA